MHSFQYSNEPDKQATLDISLCESLTGKHVSKENTVPVICSSNSNKNPTKEPVVTKSPDCFGISSGPTNNPAKQKNDLKNPRPTKASLIRMNLNKPVHKKNTKQNKQPSNLNSNPISNQQEQIETKEEILQKVDNFIQIQNNLIHSNGQNPIDPNSQLDQSTDQNFRINQSDNKPHDESLPRIPVAIRHDANNETMLSVLEPTYCPENYSDFEERSFVIENTRNSSSPAVETPAIKLSNTHDKARNSNSPVFEDGEALNSMNKPQKEDSLIAPSFTNTSPSEESRMEIKETRNNELYELLLGQQKQLSALKEQVSN